MANMQKAVSGNYLKHIDLDGEAQVLQIDECRFELVGKGTEAEHKHVLYFHHDWKPLVLNQTNIKTLIELHGAESDEWSNCLVEVFPTTTNFGGKTVDCVRMQEASKQASPF